MKYGQHGAAYGAMATGPNGSQAMLFEIEPNGIRMVMPIECNFLGAAVSGAEVDAAYHAAFAAARQAYRSAVLEADRRRIASPRALAYAAMRSSDINRARAAGDSLVKAKATLAEDQLDLNAKQPWTVTAAVDVASGLAAARALSEHECKALVRRMYQAFTVTHPQMAYFFSIRGETEAGALRTAAVLSSVVDARVVPNTLNAMTSYRPRCVGFRSDIEGFPEVAACIARILGAKYFVGDWHADGFPYEIIPP